jgi:hypothetical protein
VKKLTGPLTNANEPDTMPQVIMIRAIQRRAPTRSRNIGSIEIANQIEGEGEWQKAQVDLAHGLDLKRGGHRFPPCFVILAFVGRRALSYLLMPENAVPF